MLTPKLPVVCRQISSISYGFGNKLIQKGQVNFLNLNFLISHLILMQFLFCKMQWSSLWVIDWFDLIWFINFKRHFQQSFSYIMATSFSGGGSRREPLTMGKQLVNFITCGCESSATCDMERRIRKCKILMQVSKVHPVSRQVNILHMFVVNILHSWV